MHGPDWNTGTFDSIEAAAEYLYDIDLVSGKTLSTSEQAVFLRTNVYGDVYELSIVAVD